MGRARSPSDDRENWGDATSGSAASSSEAAAGRLPYEPISLSFSGGGIRSCAMSSGVLCWLEAHGFCTEQEGLTTIDDVRSNLLPPFCAYRAAYRPFTCSTPLNTTKLAIAAH